MALRLRYGWTKDLVRRQHQFLGQAHDPNPPLDLETVASGGTTHDATMASVASSGSTFTGGIRAAAAWTTAGTSTSTFAATVTSASGPSVIVINRGIRVHRGQGIGRR